MRTLLLIVLSEMVATAAGRNATAADVVELVFTSLYSDHDDARLAKQLRSIRMTESFDRHIALYFQNSGVGPLAAAELQTLVLRSAELPAPGKVALHIQPVPLGEARRNIESNVMRYARDYVRNLPNFLCEQVTKRFSNLSGPETRPIYLETLHHSDTLTTKLGFIQGTEQGSLARVKSVHGKPGESLSAGEFGGDMAMIFGATSNPTMQWDHWEYFRGKERAVFNYFVGLPNSTFALYYCCAPPGGRQEQKLQTYTTAIEGLVYADPDSGLISRLIVKAAHIPPNFSIRESNTIIDYGQVSIAGQEYTLPVQATVYVRTDTQRNRNELTFTKYRKFDPASVITSVDSKITYEPVKP